MNKKIFQQYYVKAMEILDKINELMSDISWSQSEEE